MALDRRGLERVFPEIAAGDQTRRELQDSLFSLAPLSNSDELQRQLTRYEELYRTALDRITLSHNARALAERIAVELPYYAECEILVAARQAPEETQDGHLPSLVVDALEHSALLLSALQGQESDDPEAYFDNLEKEFSRAESEFHNLRDHYLDRAEEVVTNITRPEFRELDELLRTPLLPPDQRRKILERVVSLDRIRPSLRPPSGADLAPRQKEEATGDPGFFRKALGLAALDARLLNLALAPGEPLPAESIEKALQALTELQTATPDYASGSTRKPLRDTLPGTERPDPTPLNPVERFGSDEASECRARQPVCRRGSGDGAGRRDRPSGAIRPPTGPGATRRTPGPGLRTRQSGC